MHSVQPPIQIGNCGRFETNWCQGETAKTRLDAYEAFYIQIKIATSHSKSIQTPHWVVLIHTGFVLVFVWYDSKVSQFKWFSRMFIQFEWNVIVRVVEAFSPIYPVRWLIYRWINKMFLRHIVCMNTSKMFWSNICSEFGHKLNANIRTLRWLSLQYIFILMRFNMVQSGDTGTTCNCSCLHCNTWHTNNSINKSKSSVLIIHTRHTHKVKWFRCAVPCMFNTANIHFPNPDHRCHPYSIIFN